MASSGSQILSADFVTIQDKAQSLMGSGSGTRGYGQTVQSADVFTGNQITKAQWDLLRYDISNIKFHQDGVLPNIITVNSGDVIGTGSGSAIGNYDSILENAIANRFNISSSTSIVTSIDSVTYSSTWTSSASAELTITFANSDEARYFFNSGGKVRISSSRIGGTSSPQNSAWSNVLISIGTQSFGAATNPVVNYYTLTNSYQDYYSQTLSTPYSANNYRLSAKTNVANNSTGTATVLYIKVTLTDGHYTGYADSVNGTLAISVEELKATGSLIPSGTFSITSPSYSLSSITAS